MSENRMKKFFPDDEKDGLDQEEIKILQEIGKEMFEKIQEAANAYREKLNGRGVSFQVDLQFYKQIKK